MRRTQIETEDFDGRVYVDDKGMKYPSVTTVINHDDSGGSGLRKWKERNDGSGDNPHWKDIFKFTRWRGTLLHYTLLNPLADRELWGGEEQKSLDKLDKFGDYKRYSDEEYKPAIKRYHEDFDTAINLFEEVKENRGITKDNTIEVEKYVRNKDTIEEFGVGYAGQLDLLYENKNGDVTLADLKTSSSLRKKHKIQGIAYKNAVDHDVDRIEVIRINPDAYNKSRSERVGEAVVHSMNRWNEDEEELWSNFKYNLKEISNAVPE